LVRVYDRAPDSTVLAGRADADLVAGHPDQTDTGDLELSLSERAGRRPLTVLKSGRGASGSAAL
jgi:hypothetical protein